MDSAFAVIDSAEPASNPQGERGGSQGRGRAGTGSAEAGMRMSLKGMQCCEEDDESRVEALSRGS